MPQTPLSNAAPYLTAARLWLYRDRRTVLELLKDDDTVPTQADAEDNTTEPGSRLYAALQWGSGEVDAHCQRGKRYVPDDLTALTGNGKARLERLVAVLAFWSLADGRWPLEKLAATTEWAFELLKQLADGETVFGFVEAAEAGLPFMTPIEPDQTSDPTVVDIASRFFGSRRRD